MTLITESVELITWKILKKPHLLLCCLCYLNPATIRRKFKKGKNKHLTLSICIKCNKLEDAEIDHIIEKN